MNRAIEHSSRDTKGKTITAALMVLPFLVGACATHDVVNERQVGDTNLSCSQIRSEIKEAEDFEAKARDEKGVNNKNVAAAVLFWPALLLSYSNFEEAIDAAEARREHLFDLGRRKGCSGF